jgi:pilus assembly protein CpaC
MKETRFFIRMMLLPGILLLGMKGVLPATSAFAQDAPQAAGESAAETEKPRDEASAGKAPDKAAAALGDENPEAPRQKRLPKVKSAFMRSRLTSDKTELEADHRVLVLATGVDKVVDLDPELKLADLNAKDAIGIGNTQVVLVNVVKTGEDKQLLIKPVGEGETNIRVRDQYGNIAVIFDVMVAKQNQVRFYERLKENLKEVEGITITLEDKNIVLRGEVLTVADYSTIFNEIGDKAYGEYVVNKVTMSPVTLGILARKIEQDLQGVVAPTLKSEVINGKIILGGTVESPEQKVRALNRAYWFLPVIRLKDPITGATNIESMSEDKRAFILQNDINVSPPPPKRDSKLVRMTVYFVELSKDFLKAFGFKWQPGFTADPSISIGSNVAGGATAGAQGGFSFAATLSSLFPALSAPPSNASYGRVMKSGTIVTKSGKPGRFQDFISLPTQALGQNSQVGNGPPIRVGFECEITPTILQGQDIELDIDVSQVSQVGKAASGTPITADHKAHTTLYMKSAEVAAVTAVNKQDVSTSFNRDDPNATSATPKTTALFNLTRSKNMSKARGQYVFFVTPVIIESASDGTEDLKKNFRMTSSNR